MPAITVAIADQQKSRRAACLRLLRPQRGIRVVAEGSTGLDALAATRLKPRILLFGLDLAQGRHMSVLSLIRRTSPRTKVILLTEHTPERLILEALGRGAPGYVDTAVLERFLPKVVRSVDAGEAWVPRRMVAKVVARLRGAPAA